VIPGGGGNRKVKVLGSRQFARYYKQKYREPDARQSVVIGKMLARCVSFLLPPCLMLADVFAGHNPGRCCDLLSVWTCVLRMWKRVLDHVCS
jgi:hypothetical protein